MNQEFPLFSDKNIRYTGTSSSNINVEQGDHVSDVLDKLVIALSLLIDKVNACSFCEGEAGELSLSDANISASGTYSQNSVISSSPATIKTTPNATGVNVNVNLDSAIESLGNVTVLKTKTTINGQKNGFPSQVLNTDKTAVSVNLRPDNFPANLESEVRYQDSTGEKTLKVRVPLSSTSATLDIPLQGGVSGATELNTQKDINDNLQSRVNALEGLVNSMVKLNISGFTTTLPQDASFQEALTQVLTEIDSIKSQLP
jgi:hypothetical protein